MKKRVLFICTHNSARSQMAEAFLNVLAPSEYVAFSAGTAPGTLNQYVVEAMKEISIDISNNKTKSVTQFLKEQFDYVVTVCDQANEACPYFPGGKRRIHKNFDDPSTFTGTHDEILKKVRIVRDEIRAFVLEYFNQGGD